MRKLILNISIITILQGTCILLAYIDYKYFNSFYHYLIIQATIFICYFIYKLRKSTEELYNLLRRWLGR